MSIKSKKIVYILFLLFFLSTLSSCFVGSFGLILWKNEIPISIQLIYYDNPDAIENPSESYPLDLEKLEVLETLESSNYDDFGVDINIRVHTFLTRKQFLYSHNGIGLRITYEDNSFQIITLCEIESEYYFFVGMYDEDESISDSQDACMFSATIEFVDAINKYFITQISLDEDYLK